MTRAGKERQKLLRHVLLAREEPEKIRRSETLIYRISLFAMLVLLGVPALFLRELGFEKYVLLLCGATAGMVAFFAHNNVEANRSLRELQEFIDIDKLRAAIETEAD